MKDFMARINYKFKDEKFLKHALTHSSYANEGNRGLESNERLEFLGDSVLSIITSEYLYSEFTDLPEGDLSKLRARLVCEKCLYGYALQIELAKEILLGKGEENSGGRGRISIIADALEAVIAAIYLDGGYGAAKKFVLKYVVPESHIEEDLKNEDHKTKLQEIIQQNREERLAYVLESEAGPDHDKMFNVEVHLNSNIIGTGKGHSKKEAEQEAAREALKLMGY